MSKEAACNAGETGDGFDPSVGKISWKRAWQPTPVFLPGKPQGQRSLAGYSPWGHRESDTTEVTEHAYIVYTYPPSDCLRNKLGGKISFKLAIVTCDSGTAVKVVRRSTC